MIVKPTAHDYIINSIGPVKFRKLGSVGRMTNYIKRPTTYHPLKVKRKYSLKSLYLLMEWKHNCSVRGLEGYHLALLWQANPSALERL